MHPESPDTSAIPRSIRAPNGARITVNDLPLSVDRWTVSKKLLIMIAIKEGLITMEEASKRYFLSIEELDSWKKLDAKHGPTALRSTRLQDYRGTHVLG